MPVRPELVPLDTAKTWAKRLVKSSKTLTPSQPLTLSQCQLAIAHMLGYKHWHDLEEGLFRESSPTHIMPSFLYRGLNPESKEQWFQFWADACAIEGCTEVHLEYRDDVAVKVRVLGHLHEYFRFPASDAAQALSEILPELAANSLIQQQGRFMEYSAGNIYIPGNMQVSRKELKALYQFLPVYNEEKKPQWNIVLHAKERKQSIKLSSMQLPGGIKHVLEEFAQRKTGLFLFSGATGSGKSTLMGAMLDYVGSLQTGSAKCYAIEDAPEGLMGQHTSCISFERNKGDNQSHENNIEKALNSAMRADPDILAIGEIRDPHTAQGAIKALEGGCMVMASIYRTQQDTLQRLEAFASHPWDTVVNGWAECKLLNIVCQKCSTLLPSGERRRSSKGCASCRGIGATGRQLVLDVWEVRQGVPMQIFSEQEQAKNLVRRGLVDLEDAEAALGHLGRRR